MNPLDLSSSSAPSTRRDLLRMLAAFTGLAGAGVHLAAAHESAPGGPKVTPVTTHELPDIPGQSVTLVSLVFAPGAASEPHKHPGSVLVYVLEGAVELQAGESPLTTVRAGETFFEPAGVVHAVARNPSKTEPARAIAFLLGKTGEPLTLPAK